MKTVGVLALQGDFEAHRNALERAGAKAQEVRTAEDMAKCDGLVIPGGESTTMLKPGRNPFSIRARAKTMHLPSDHDYRMS